MTPACRRHGNVEDGGTRGPATGREVTGRGHWSRDFGHSHGDGAAACRNRAGRVRGVSRRRGGRGSVPHDHAQRHGRPARDRCRRPGGRSVLRRVRRGNRRSGREDGRAARVRHGHARRSADPDSRGALSRPAIRGGPPRDPVGSRATTRDGRGRPCRDHRAVRRRHHGDGRRPDRCRRAAVGGAAADRPGRGRAPLHRADHRLRLYAGERGARDLPHGARERAAFGFTTAPDGATFWFSRVPDDERPRAEIAEVIAAQWRSFALARFEGEPLPCADIIAATGDEIFGGHSYDVPETRIWSTSEMVLVGDAAHAASPAAGQGASMALEDSVVLAKCLRDLPDPTSAFAAYERLRRERVEKLVAASAGGDVGEERGWLYSHHIDWDAKVGSP